MNKRHPLNAAIGTALLLPAIALANPNPPQPHASQYAAPGSLHAHVQAQMSHTTTSHSSMSLNNTPVARSPHVRANGQVIAAAPAKTPSTSSH